MADLRIENIAPQLNGYQRLAMEVLSTALNDICPINEPPDNLSDAALEIFLLTRKMERADWLKSQLNAQEKYSKEWEETENEYERRYSNLVNERDKAIDEIIASDNASEVDERLEKALETWDKRQKALERRLAARRRGFKNRIESQAGKKYSDSQVSDLRLGLEDSIDREITQFEARRRSAIEKITLTRNAERVVERITEKKVIFDMRVEKLNTSWERRQRLHNKHWAEDDVLGAAVHWFINDVQMVYFWCLVAGITMKTCYNGVKGRLDMLGYSVPEIDDLLEKIKKDEIPPPKLDFIKSLPKLDAEDES